MTQPRHWRLSAAIREAVFGAVASGPRSWLMLLVAVLMGVAMSGLQVADWTTLDRQLDAADASGHTVISFGATPQAQTEIAISSCEALTHAPGVEVAGAMIPSGRTTVDQLGSGISAVRASSSLVPELTRAEVAVGDLLAPASAGVITGDSGYVRTYVAASPRPPGIDVNSAVISPLLTADVSTAYCVARLSSFADVDALAPILLSSLSSSGAPPAVRSVSDTFDPVDAYLNRTTRWAPAGVGVVCAFISLVLLLARGSEIAAYRLSGTSRRSMMLLCVIEQSVYAAVMWCSVTLTALALAPFLGSVSAVVAAGGIAACVWLALYSVGAYVNVRRDPTALARER